MICLNISGSHYLTIILCTFKSAACFGSPFSGSMACPLVLRWRACPPILQWRACPPVLRWRACPPVLRWRACPPVLRWRACPPVLQWRVCPPVLRWQACPPFFIGGLFWVNVLGHNLNVMAGKAPRTIAPQNQ